MKAKNKQNILLGTLFLLPFTLLACVTVLLFSSYREMDQAFKWVARSNGVNAQIQNLMKNFIDAETGERGYLLTARNDYLEPYQAASSNIAREFDLLRNLTRDNPDQQAILDRLEVPMNRKLFLMAQTVSTKKKGHDSEALRLVLTDESRHVMDEIRSLITEMSTVEGDLLRKRQLKADSHAQFNHHLAISLMLLDTLALAAIAYMLKRLQSLNRMVTVCAWSKTIKSGGRWISFEAYLREQFGLSVSHGMSKEVYEKLMNETEDEARAGSKEP